MSRGRKGSLSLRIRMAIVVRDRCVCQICREPVTRSTDLEIDHVLPVHQGGGDHEDNLRTTHRACNQGRLYGSEADYSDMCRWFCDRWSEDGYDDPESLDGLLADPTECPQCVELLAPFAPRQERDLSLLFEVLP